MPPCSEGYKGTEASCAAVEARDGALSRPGTDDSLMELMLVGRLTCLPPPTFRGRLTHTGVGVRPKAQFPKA